MKATYIATTVIGLALAAPLAAHHNSPFGEELEIGDAMERHEEAINELVLPDTASGAMDPSNTPSTDMSDGSRINDANPQPDRIGTVPLPGSADGGSRGGVPWSPL